VANAERLWKLLDRERVEQTIIVGHSMGARVAGGMGALRSEDARVGAFLLDRDLFRWICERSGRCMASSPWLVRRALSFLYREKDRLFRPRMARRFLEKYPYQAQVSLIEGAGHCPMETHPNAFLQAMSWTRTPG